MNPRVHPDSLEVYVPVEGETETGLLRIQLELVGYSLEFGDEEGCASYDVFDLKVEEAVSKGGSCIQKTYIKRDIRGQAQFWDPQKVHNVKNMLTAKFGVVNFDGGDNFIHQPHDNTYSSSA